MKKSQKITIGILFTLLPLGFTFLVSFNTLQNLKDNNILGQSFDVDSWNLTLTILTIIIPIVFIGLNSIISDWRAKKMEDLTSSLLEMTKDSFYSLLREICGDTNLPIEMRLPLRIYKPIFSDSVVLNSILKFIPNRAPVKFVAVSLDGKILNKKTQFYVERTKKMEQAVPQGIVGKSYIDNDLVVDDNLKENSLTYNLTKAQMDKVQDLDFAISYPIRNQNDKITHIVTLDCKEKFKVPEANDERFKSVVKRYINDVRKNFPILFKY